jgi:hypothetical protein
MIEWEKVVLFRPDHGDDDATGLPPGWHMVGSWSRSFQLWPHLVLAGRVAVGRDPSCIQRQNSHCLLAVPMSFFPAATCGSGRHRSRQPIWPVLNKPPSS